MYFNINHKNLLTQLQSLEAFPEIYKFLLSKKLTKFVPINPDPPVIMTFFIF